MTIGMKRTIIAIGVLALALLDDPSAIAQVVGFPTAVPPSQRGHFVYRRGPLREVYRGRWGNGLTANGAMFLMHAATVAGNVVPVAIGGGVPNPPTTPKTDANTDTDDGFLAQEAAAQDESNAKVQQLNGMAQQMRDARNSLLGPDYFPHLKAHANALENSLTATGDFAAGGGGVGAGGGEPAPTTPAVKLPPGAKTLSKPPQSGAAKKDETAKAAAKTAPAESVITPDPAKLPPLPAAPGNDAGKAKEGKAPDRPKDSPAQTPGAA